MENLCSQNFPITLSTAKTAFAELQAVLVKRHEEDKLCPVFVSALQPAEERACRKLANRLLISRDNISGSMKLKLGESEAFVQALQDAFAENSFDFFINATPEALTFRVEASLEDVDDGAENDKERTKTKFRDVSVDKADAPDSLVRRRKRVLDAIRQKKRLRAYLSGTSSVLNVVFQSSDGATNESMNWTTFIGHLENMKNPYVAIEMLPKHSQSDNANGAKNFYQRTKADKDGGHNRGSMQLLKFRTVPRLMLCQLNIQTSCISASGGQNVSGERLPQHQIANCMQMKFPKKRYF